MHTTYSLELLARAALLQHLLRERVLGLHDCSAGRGAHDTTCTPRQQQRQQRSVALAGASASVEQLSDAAARSHTHTHTATHRPVSPWSRGPPASGRGRPQARHAAAPPQTRHGAPVRARVCGRATHQSVGVGAACCGCVPSAGTACSWCVRTPPPPLTSGYSLGSRLSLPCGAPAEHTTPAQPRQPAASLGARLCTWRTDQLDVRGCAGHARLTLGCRHHGGRVRQTPALPAGGAERLVQLPQAPCRAQVHAQTS
jgi:hypothetical protein